MESVADQNRVMNNPAGFDITHDGVVKAMFKRDSTAMLFAVVSMMDRVEHWTVESAATRDPSVATEVQASLASLSALVERFGDRIPPSSDVFLQLMTWVHSSSAIHCIDFLSRCQPEFLTAFLEHLEATGECDVNAQIALARFRALEATVVLDRIFSPENCRFVMGALLNMRGVA